MSQERKTLEIVREGVTPEELRSIILFPLTQSWLPMLQVENGLDRRLYN
jgi:hypothetical protein